MAEPHVFAVRVYYEDTDFSGNVYHAAYLKFMERARTELLRAQGIHHAELGREGLAFAVRSMQLDFRAAAHIDDVLRVETLVAGASGARLQLSQGVWRDAELLVDSQVVVVAINMGGKPTRLPAALRALAD
ncbi:MULTISPECIES: tol-pal system-associated acyl-CoA thioesterase [unclassified Devosia]|uniref:tol-pal system-associated acyl-CoA thioesterase n=1 Tax=unclassified Devosia TaxID=196773 RepID=UPI00155351A7|nr:MULTISPECIES: tol-pal system-associated acyl-CoA thioesterase [unclassified Devosia]